MRDFVIIAALTTLLAGSAFAADTKPKVSTAADAKPKVLTDSGSLVAYTAADAAKATPAEITVKLDGRKRTVTLVLDANAAVEGKDKKAVDIATVKAGAKVVVGYIRDETRDAVVAVSVVVQ